MAISSEERRKLAHLLRRAGFGPRPSEWAEWSALGVAGATEKLLYPERTPDNMVSLQDAVGDNVFDFDDFYQVRQWWVFRMANSKRPLEEKMTLFWHNHFATAIYKVGSSRRMWRQNEMFRRLALGNFRTMLQAVMRDPATLVWLDGHQNRREAPNENFARELLELFTLGVDGGYTEKDIKEAARSLTGWRFGERDEPVFDPYGHDDGEKTVLGQTGNWHPDDIIDIVVKHPSTGKRLATKLWHFFIGTVPTDDQIAPLAKIYLDGYEIRPLVSAILKHPVFYSEAAYNAKVKSPAEFAVGALRAFDAPMVVGGRVGEVVANMGQDLLNPPNVGGWRENEGWINSRTLLARVNFASYLAERAGYAGKVATLLTMSGAQLNPDDPSAPPTFESHEAMINAVWDALMPGRPMDAITRAALLEFSRGGKDAKPGDVQPNQRLGGVVALVMSAPSYQLA